MTDVLLINPPSPDGSIIIRDIHRSGRTSREGIIWPQTNLAYLAAMVAPAHSVDIVDCIAERMGWEALERVIRERKPRYVLGYVITSTLHNDMKTFDLAKKVGAFTVSAGPHITDQKGKALDEFPSLDFGIHGEAELTFKELVDTLDKGGDVSRIQGLIFRKDGRARANPERAFVQNLDELPIPLHEKLPIDKYVFPFISSKFTFVVASRGCPFECIYCRQTVMWKQRVRHRSAEHLMKELRYLKRIGVRNFIFHSDTFTIDRKRVVALCQKMVEENLGLSWACNSRVDTIDQETLGWMKKAGCWMIAYGIESASQEILDRAKKRATVKQAVDAVHWTHDAGIKVYGYFIIGLPGETKETIRQTIEMAKSLPITFAIFHTAAPYPGTEFNEIVTENDWLDMASWEDVDQGGMIHVSYPDLSAQDIMKGVKDAYLAFYLRPGAIVNLCLSIRNFRDLAHLSSLAWSQLAFVKKAGAETADASA